MKKKIIGLALGLFILFLLVNAQVKIPEPYGYVNDFANIIPDEVEQQLEARLRAYEQDASIEFAVVTIQSLQGLIIEDYSMKLAEKWKVGKADKDNGLILLIAVEDRKLRFEVGYGLEGDLPDITCQRILDNKIRPYFKKNPPDYSNGIMVGVDAVIEKLGTLSWEERLEKRKEEERRRKEATRKVGKIFLAVIISIAAIILLVFLIRALIKEIERAKRLKELRRKAEKKCAEAEESLNKSLELSRRVRNVFHSEIYLSGHLQRADSLVGGIHQRKDNVLSELKMAQAALKKDPDLAFQHVSSAADTLLEITDLIKEMESIQKGVKKAKQEAPGLIRKAVKTVEEVQKKLEGFREGGFRIKKFDLKLNFTESLSDSTEPKDYELICNQANGTIVYAEGFLEGIVGRVNLKNRLEGDIKEIPRKIDTLKKKVPTAQKKLSELKKDNPKETWRPIENNLKSIEGLFKMILSYISQATELNSMKVQKFEAADFQIKQSQGTISKIDSYLNAPAKKLKEIAEAKSSAGSFRETLKTKIAKAERLIRDSDVEQAAKRLLREARGKSDTANALLVEDLVNWIAVVLLLNKAVDLANQAIKRAKQDINEAEEDRRRRRREEERRRSYHSSSSWSSGGGGSSSSGGFGGFGGGSFGGGGASNGW